jgi:hypothetical protein
MDDRLGQFEPLFHTSGVGLDAAVAAFLKAHIEKDFVGAFHGFLAGHPGKLAEIRSEGNSVNSRNKTVILGHVTHIAADQRLLSSDVIAENAPLAPVRSKKAEEDADQSALPGSVGAQKADGSFWQTEVNALEGFHFAVAEMNVSDLDTHRLSFHVL